MKKLLIAIVSLATISLIGCNSNELTYNESKVDYPVENIAETTVEIEKEIQTNELILEEIEDETWREIELPSSKVLDSYYKSQDALPTGCEIISLEMELNSVGIETSTEDLLKSNILKSSLLRGTDECLVGADPNIEFIGNPAEGNGFGCYSGAIEQMAIRYLALNKIQGYKVKKLENYELEDLCKKYIMRDIPVMIWASISMAETYKDPQYQWKIEDTGEWFEWISNEHCLVLTGFDEYHYYFNDPLKGKNVGYSKEIVEQRYKELGKQGIVIEQEDK